MKNKGLPKKVGIAIVAALMIVTCACACGKKGGSSSASSSSASTQQSSSAQSTKSESSSSSAKEEPKESSSSKEEAPAENTNKVDETLIRPEFKEAMDSYEAFFDEYVELMQQYKNDPTNAELLTQYSEMLSKETKMLKEFDDWEKDDSMTDAEAAYYLEVHARIYKKLAEVA